MIEFTMVDLPGDQFFRPPPAVVDDKKPKKIKVLADPIDLMVLKTLYGCKGGLRCSEIRDKINDLGIGSRISQQSVWHALRSLRQFVEIRRDRSSPKPKRPVYTLKNGGGSHLKSEIRHWTETSTRLTDWLNKNAASSGHTLAFDTSN